MKTAIIVIDSGYSQESLAGCGQVLAFIDVHEQRTVTGAPDLAADDLLDLSGDPLGHGSIVLKNIRRLLPEAPLILVKAWDPQGMLIRSAWNGGQKVRNGWTEAYLQAVELCRQLGYTSVANCSFGGFLHAMDGTGWESFQLSTVCGAGKPGHVVVAAAGAGDGRAIHASWKASPGDRMPVTVYQEEPSNYNLWVSEGAAADWTLEVWQGNDKLASFDGSQVPQNFWNKRQQLTFRIEARGRLSFVLSRERSTAQDSNTVSRFDCWIPRNDAWFLDHVDSTLIAEPAVFPQVIAAGLRNSFYSPTQFVPGDKPDVLLDGGGPISFRLPELTAHVARMLSANPALDAQSVRGALLKLL